MIKWRGITRDVVEVFAAPEMLMKVHFVGGRPMGSGVVLSYMRPQWQPPTTREGSTAAGWIYFALIKMNK